MAVLYDGELSDFWINTFYGAWTPQKRGEIIGTISKAIERYGITEIVMKTPKPAHSTQSMKDLINDIRQLSDQLHIKLTACTISVLTRRYSGNSRGNKHILVQAIIRKYPQHRKLADLYMKERSNSDVYYVKIFEAIACAEMALRTEQ